MFDAARRGGRLGALDWACRAAAFAGALEGGLEPPLTLFVNVEPEALDMPCPEHFARLQERAGERLRIVLEITERALTARPAELLHAIARVRGAGWGIALDDVGADTRSLALMPLLRPEVVKLDLRLVQTQPSTEIAEIVNTVNAERERTGAVVLAEGIETEAHLVTARALGATLAQGWLFGRPGRLPIAAVGGRAPDRALGSIDRPAESAARTPYDAVAGTRETRLADKRLLLSISLRLEQQAAALGETAVILSAFQSAERFTAATQRRYTMLAGDTAFVAALGVGMEREPAPGVRGAALDPDDPLLGEWSVIVLGPHFAAALVAQDLDDDGPEMERRFEFALTYDRALVIEAANTLMRRVIPLGVAPVPAPAP
jgi:EAL domain-containing protein (putative c-di-GMP-specific phosphodiesterase class I)